MGGLRFAGALKQGEQQVRFGLGVNGVVHAAATVVDGPGGLSAWRCAIYAWMTRQAASASSYYRLPANQVVELGTQVVL